ncbi:N-acetylmuramoyl-L-alanine amidase [Paenisporosarcina sp.]|uniref:N-acetylmuramoyl-L-alanine amidase n=1 Tax=Paenisporosarcina sp. TaxID=1932001 RepID=UPI003C729398
MKRLIGLLSLLLLVSIVTPLKSTSANTMFSDVGTTHRAQEEIYYLVQGKIASGVSSTQFVPDKQVTRGEAAAMIGRALGMNGEKVATKFADVPSSNFASGYIKQMVERGIISGYPNGTFRPYETLTRGQMAVLMNRAFQYGGNTVSVASASSTLMDKGIAQGMADGLFGSDLTIKRGDFAVFLARGINTEFRTTQTETFDQIMYVNTNNLYFRTGPNTLYPWIQKLHSGQEVQYSYSIGEWSVIKVGEIVGYVHSSFIQMDKPSDIQPPVTPTPEPEPLPVPVPIPVPVPTPPVGSPNTLSDLVVIIDPGHGGTDSGAPGNGFLEKNVVLNISRHMNSYFAQTPIKTFMTRTDDYFVTRDFRVDFAAKNKGDVFVSIHANAFNGIANGQETYYYARTAAANPYEKQSRALAMYMQNRILEAWNLTDRGVKNKGFDVIRENTMPATLVEVGFIDSSKDIAYIQSEVEREKMGKALFLATLDYFYHFDGRQDVLPLYEQFGATPSNRIH